MSAVVSARPEDRDDLPATQSSSIIQMISRIAQDPTVDLDRFERLIAMQERMEARQAERAFTAALSAMQPNLPVVTQRGTIVIRDKTNPKTIIQETPFAKWEDINEAISPHLAEHGFSLSFRAERDGDRVIVRGILSHKDGHKEETILPLSLDTTGSKNNVQAVGSSISYGKRYTAGMLLNITSRASVEADDDGHMAGRLPAPEVITEDQAMTIRELLESTNSDQAAFLKHAKAPSISEILAKDFQPLVTLLRRKGQKR